MQTVAVEEHNVADAIANRFARARKLGSRGMIPAFVANIPNPEAPRGLRHLKRNDDRDRRTALVTMVRRKTFRVEMANAPALGDRPLARKDVNARAAPSPSLHCATFTGDARHKGSHRSLKSRGMGFHKTVGLRDIVEVVSALVFFEVRVKCTTQRKLLARKRTRPIGMGKLDPFGPSRTLGGLNVSTHDDSTRGRECRIRPVRTVEVRDERSQ